MKHRIGFNRLGRKSSHRKAMCRNMVTSLFQHERISTTKAKALEVRRIAEKMITRAKEDSVHNRRIIAKDINDKAVVAKLFTTLGPRFEKRAGGYTRILKVGQRQGDAAEMVLLELVDREEEKKPGKSGKKQSTAKAEKATKKVTEAKEAIDSEKEVTPAKAAAKKSTTAAKGKTATTKKPAVSTSAKKPTETKSASVNKVADDKADDKASDDSSADKAEEKAE